MAGAKGAILGHEMTLGMEAIDGEYKKSGGLHGVELLNHLPPELSVREK